MKTLFDRLRSLLIWAVAFPVFVAACLALWAGSFVLSGPPLERLIKRACRLILFFCGIRLSVSGGENIEPGRQYIVMMNHVNFFDPFVVNAGFPGFARGAEEESHFHWPLYGGMIRRLGVIPIDRKDTAKAVDSLKRAAGWIRSRPGYSFIILPEGTRTRDGELGAFKRGGFLLALETGLEILPLVQAGAGRINRRGSRLVRPGRIEMTIERAVQTEGYSKKNIGELVGRVREVFLSRLESPAATRRDSGEQSP
ncbi:MAG: lysophospholipid acyltransferase family protein [Candidatus Aminicenantales bacterium]